MPPQIKQDMNRSGWETTDMPSVCERCLPDNPYVQMLKEDYGEACKTCTRPFTVFRWKADRTARPKRTGICLTCARLKNCCQCCMLDLSFGLPTTIRDAALKMVAPGPQSEINREYFAQNNETELEEGRGLEGYEKTDEKARELLRRLAQTEPYYKKQRRLEAEELKQIEGGPSQKQIEAAPSGHVVGPIRTAKSAYGSGYLKGGSTGGGGGGGSASKKTAAPKKSAPIKPEDILPPADQNITSLFVTGVEDDLPEHDIRTYFSQYGQLRSLVCSHRSHCAFVNYMKREDAEKAAATCCGRAVVKAVPLRVQWGKPKPLDSMPAEQRMENARAARGIAEQKTKGSGNMIEAPKKPVVALPPGQGDVEYAAMAGE